MSDVTCDSMRRRQATIKVITLGGSIAAVAFVVSLGALIYIDGQAPGVDSVPRDIAGLAVAVSFFGYFAAWGIVGAILASRAAAERRRLEERGVAATAVITRVHQTGGSVNDQPIIEFTLRVELPERAPHTAHHCQVIPQLFLARLTPDATVPVVVDPDGPEAMTIDTTSWETSSA